MNDLKRYIFDRSQVVQDSEGYWVKHDDAKAVICDLWTKIGELQSAQFWLNRILSCVPCHIAEHARQAAGYPDATWRPTEKPVCEPKTQTNLFLIKQLGRDLYWTNCREHGCGWSSPKPKQSFSKSELVRELSSIIGWGFFCDVEVLQLKVGG